VRFLGVGGFVIRRGSDVVMTAPLYSNPPPPAFLVEICPNRRVLDHYFQEHELAAEMTDLRAILVGHGHYDHLMDVPYFLEKAAGARVYGSVTTRRILAGYGPQTAARVTALNEPGQNRVDFTHCGEEGGRGCVVSPGEAGRWLDVAGTDGRVRVQAFCSRHPPHGFMLRVWRDWEPAGERREGFRLLTPTLSLRERAPGALPRRGRAGGEGANSNSMPVATSRPPPSA